MAELILLAHAAATLFMAGVIWFVQVVHYPLFGKVGVEGFVAYAEAHSRLTSLVVGPPMLLEASTAVFLIFIRPDSIPAALVWLGLVLVAIVWASTAILQVPRHRALGSGFNVAAHRFLVLSNRVRTACWSMRSLLVLWMLSKAAGR